MRKVSNIMTKLFKDGKKSGPLKRSDIFRNLL